MSKGPLLVVLAGAALAVGGWLWMRPSPGEPMPPPSPPPATASPAPAPPPAPVQGASPLEARLYRSRDELFVIARRTADGLPAAGARVSLRDAQGVLLKRGVADACGVLRASIPAGTAGLDIALDGTGLDLSLPPVPPAAAPSPPMLADRPLLRPGDRLRVAVFGLRWLSPDRPAWLDSDLGDPALDHVPFMPVSGEEEKVAPGPWTLLEARVPSDARPCSSQVETGSGRVLDIPLGPRFGEDPRPAPDGPVGPGSLDDPRMELRDGVWRVRLLGREAPSAVLLFARRGDRFLAHATSAPEGPEVALALGTETAGGEDVRVTLVALRRDGFEEHSEMAPADDAGPFLEIGDPDEQGVRVRVRPAKGSPEGTPAPPAALAAAADEPTGRFPGTSLATGDDPDGLLLPLPAEPGPALRVRALAVLADGGVLRAERILPHRADFPTGTLAGPRWVRPGDRVDGLRVLPLVRAAPPVRVRVLATPDSPASFPATARPSSGEAPVRWSVTAPPDAEGPLRVRSGGAIVVETRVGPAGTGGDDGRSGTLLLSDLPGSISVESGLPGLEGVVFEAFLAPRAEAGALDGGVAVARSLPEKGRVGQPFEVGLVLRPAAEWNGDMEVEVPLPRGVVPAEDGWALRERAWGGARVEVEEDHVSFHLHWLPAGETRLAFRVRPIWPGRYSAPPATAAAEDPRGPHGQSAAATIDIRQ